MENLPLVWLLPIVTIVLFVVFALMSRKRTKQLQNDPEHEPSSLAKDGPGPNPVGPDK